LTELEAARAAHADEVAAAAGRETLLNEERAALEQKSAEEKAVLETVHESALEMAASELEDFRTSHAEELRVHRTSTEEEQKKLETQLLDLANETSVAHATALGEAASELSKYRSEHAAELEGCQENAE
jgi:hypothetical protein